MSVEEATLKNHPICGRQYKACFEVKQWKERFEKKMRILRTNAEDEFKVIQDEIERGTYNAPYGLMELHDRCFSVLKNSFKEVLGE